MAENTLDRDSQYIERVANAASIKGLVDDPRWPLVIGVIQSLRLSADNRAKMAMKSPSFDGIAQATHYGGQVAYADLLLGTFERMYQAAEKILEDARQNLPRAPQPKATPRDSAAPEGTPAKE